MARAFAPLLALGLALFAGAPPAAAQTMDSDAAPVSGTLAPGSGTAEARLRVRPGVASPADGCSESFSPAAPDAVVDWAGGDLRVWVRAAFDATMAVRRPDGAWACDDDTDGLLPVVSLAAAPAGQYAVWLGSFVETPEPLEMPWATLYAGAPLPPPVLDAQAQPLAGTIRAAGGFEAARGAIEVSVRAGGPDDVARVDLGATPDPPSLCSGYVDAARPTAAVDYDAAGGTGALAVRAWADEDLVLVIRTPSGQVLCNDDADGRDPAVGVEGPASGVYAVWVGTFGIVGGPVGATLSLSEALPEGVLGDDASADGALGEPRPYSGGVYLPLDLAAVPDVRLRADPDAAASAPVTVRPQAPNPVQGPSCRGAVEPAATAAVELDGPGPFALTATGDWDLTLTLRTPSGGWLCSDDADGLNPGIQIDAPEPGRYLVWLGAFAELGDEVAAALAVTAGELVVSRPSSGAHALRQSGGDYAGTEVRAGAAVVALDWRGATAETAAVQAGGPVLNPVRGAVCGGFVSERPTAEVQASGGHALSFAARADEDLTLTVRAPDGTWTCGDDADGTDPRVEVDGGEGVYSVWVGTYYRRTAPTPARLEFRVLPPVLPPPPPPSIRG